MAMSSVLIDGGSEVMVVVVAGAVDDDGAVVVVEKEVKMVAISTSIGTLLPLPLLPGFSSSDCLFLASSIESQAAGGLVVKLPAVVALVLSEVIVVVAGGDTLVKRVIPDLLEILEGAVLLVVLVVLVVVVVVVVVIGKELAGCSLSSCC